MRRRTTKPRIVVVRHEQFLLDPHLRRHVLTLRDAGFDVDVVSDPEPGRRRCERNASDMPGITVIRLPMGHKRGTMLRYLLEYGWWPLLATAALAMRSLWRRYDFVEIHNMPDWLMIAAIPAKLRGAHVTLVMRENMPELFAIDHDLPPGHPIVRGLLAVERVCARLADHLIAPHEMAGRILVRQGIPAGKITVVPNVPDERRFLQHVPVPGRDVLHMSNDGASQTEVPAGKFRLVTHGSLLERYGIQTLLEAVAKVKNDIPGLHLEVIGEGEYRDRLMELASDLGLQGTVEFSHDWIPYDQIAARLVNADVGVVPMWTDFVPNKLMDYLALGLPAITTDSEALRLYFDDDAVYFVQQRNADQLAEAILTLYRDPARRAALAAEGHRVYGERLSWRVTGRDYLMLYGGMMDAVGAVNTSDDEAQPALAARS